MAIRRVGVALLVTPIALFSLPAIAVAQRPAGADASRVAQTPAAALPRTPDGQPDLQGIWFRQVVGMATYSLEGGNNDEHLLLSAGCSQGVVGCERSAAEIDAQVAQRRGQHITIIVDPPNGKVPYQPWAAAKRQDITDHHTNPRGAGDIDPQSRCFPVGVPRMNYSENNGIQIQQIAGRVLLTYEFNHMYRIIPLDGGAHPANDVKLWMGDSRGRWEGDTLVIDVANHNDKTWFDIIGTFHSDALHVVERYKLVNADTIHYEATIEDPKVFTQPWKIAFPLQRVKQPDFEMLEMACTEGQRSFDLMIGGKGK